MKTIIESLRTPKMNKWQNISLDILSKKMEFAKTRVAKDGNSLVSGYDEHNELTAEAMRGLCRINFKKRYEAIGENLLTPNWGDWLGIRIIFNISEKQYELIRRSLVNKADNNFNEHLFNDSLELFPGVWVQFKREGLCEGKYGSYYKMVGSVFYTKERTDRKPTVYVA